jgi:hypothetical protein
MLRKHEKVPWQKINKHRPQYVNKASAFSKFKKKNFFVTF